MTTDTSSVVLDRLDKQSIGSFQKLSQLTLLFLAYILTARLDSLIFGEIDPGVALIWPAAGIAVAGLYLGGYRLWPAVIAGSFLSNYLFGTSLVLSILLASSNTLQALLGAYLLNYFRFQKQMARLRDVLALFLTAFTASLVSPSLGLLAIGLSMGLQPETLPQGWVTWWVGGILSMSVLTPLVVTWFDKVGSTTRIKVIELVASFVLLIGINFLLFFTPFTAIGGISLVYFMLMPLFWISLRFKPKYVVLAVFIISALAVAGLLRAMGSGGVENPGQRLVSIQSFTIIISMIFYILSAVYSERKTAVKHLQEHVKQLEQALGTIRQHALTDILTGLPNRKAMEERFGITKSLANRHNHKVAMLFLDLDQFKNINDTLGHSVGDLVLKQVAARLQDSIREVDTVSRLGGDEFIIVLSEIQTEDDIQRVAQKVLESLNHPVEIDEHIIHTSTSIGIAIYPEAGDTIHDLLRSADIALYRAKDKGRNQYQFYDQEMKNQLHARLSMEQDLKRAIQREQLRLVYQPYIDMRTERIKGVEALIRWEHPVLGTLFPKDFIPIAEDTGIINSIGAWVLNRACKQSRAWKRLGIKLPVSINLSAKQFYGNNLVEIVSQSLLKYNLDPKDVDLEITETVAMQTLYAGAQLEELVKMGVSISMDDFGTGYSSLGNIRSLYLNRLKIDKAFVSNLLQNPQDEAIIRTIISMGHTLGLRVCAEGIETEEQKILLQRMGCDSGQGYLFYPPLDGREIVRAVQAQDQIERQWVKQKTA